MTIAREVTAMRETCPVCGMEVDKNSTEVQSTYGGKTYSFCSESCRDKWDANPEKYAHAEQSA